MRNEFIQHPAGNVIVEVDRLFGIRDGIIRIGVEESKAVISGAENILILSGRGSGTNRVYDSIKNAMLNAYSTAPGYDLFSASKVIVQIIYPANNELLFLEIGDMPPVRGEVSFQDRVPVWNNRTSNNKKFRGDIKYHSKKCKEIC